MISMKVYILYFENSQKGICFNIMIWILIIFDFLLCPWIRLWMVNIFQRKRFCKKSAFANNLKQTSHASCVTDTTLLTAFLFHFIFVDKHNYKAQKMYNHPRVRLYFSVTLFFPNLRRHKFMIVVYSTKTFNTQGKLT